MIEINLLPEEYRKKKNNYSKMINKYKNLALPGVGAIVISIVVILFVIIVFPKFQNMTLRKLESNWKKIEMNYQEVIKLKDEQKKLQEALNNINQIANKRILWARRLNDISDSLPSEIQLTELLTKIEKSKDKDKPDRSLLVISGIVPSFPGERAIGDFIKGLRGNPGFIKDFPEIEPPSTETTPDGFKKFSMKCYMAVEVKETPQKVTKREKDEGK